MRKSERTRAEIIEAVIRIIEETGSTDMTISMIAKKADVAVGLINYHYETKQALIIDSIKTYIEEHISSENALMPQKQLSPRELLTASLTSYADFLVAHAVLCRLNILYCLDGSIEDKTIAQALQYYCPIIKSINNSLSDEQAIMALRIITSTIQLAFLESNLPSNVSLDFLNKKDRDIFINKAISMVID